MAASNKPIFPKTPHVESGTGAAPVVFTGAVDGSRVDTVVLFNNGGSPNANAVDIRFGATILRQIAIGAITAKSYREEILDLPIASGDTIEVEVVSGVDANLNVTIQGGDY